MSRSLMALPALALAVAVALASCATGTETLEPRHVGDHCFEVCPEGMVCKGTAVATASTKTEPGRCELGPDRCNADVDCRTQPAHCIGASRADIGFCAYGLPF
jgi:hypothetical protein